uniref:RNA polymerase beta subunit n=1 Tax=Cephaleuros karstenii TaxID=1985640 RepID=UPI001EDEEDC8|nr:RNA polymerase beta subunit [Cephaleuros karstenii]UIB39096.1 RNA polymerase beta subunit [Cephaleuros karstenii]
MSGRHGNKGIVSKILPFFDMPYLIEGTPIEIILNPLGVPSRMNVGQIYESLLSLVGFYKNEYFRIPPFDENYDYQFSRNFVYWQLNQHYHNYKKKILIENTSQKKKPYSTRNSLFLNFLQKKSKLKKPKECIGLNPYFPGKMRIFDGKTGETFFRPIIVGKSYMLKLIHLVDHKIHARSTGPYALITQQPLKGKRNQGGQRVGEMEVWALYAFGSASLLFEMLTTKSDDPIG